MLPGRERILEFTAVSKVLITFCGTIFLTLKHKYNYFQPLDPGIKSFHRFKSDLLISALWLRV